MEIVDKVHDIPTAIVALASIFAGAWVGVTIIKGLFGMDR